MIPCGITSRHLPSHSVTCREQQLCQFSTISGYNELIQHKSNLRGDDCKAFLCSTIGASDKPDPTAEAEFAGFQNKEDDKDEKEKSAGKAKGGDGRSDGTNALVRQLMACSCASNKDDDE